MTHAQPTPTLTLSIPLIASAIVSSAASAQPYDSDCANVGDLGTRDTLPHEVSHDAIRSAHSAALPLITDHPGKAVN